MFPITVPKEFVELCRKHANHTLMLVLIRWRGMIDNQAELDLLKKELSKKKNTMPAFAGFDAWASNL